jgi:hypothetical protein
LLLLAVPPLVGGIKNTWIHKRDIALPVLVFAFGVMLVYTSATTNAGAMFRWRMQALPFFIMMTSYGVYLQQKGMLFRLMQRFYR